MTLEEGKRDKYRLSLGGIAAPKENTQIQSERFKKLPDALEEFLKNLSLIHIFRNMWHYGTIDNEPIIGRNTRSDDGFSISNGKFVKGVRPMIARYILH